MTQNIKVYNDVAILHTQKIRSPWPSLKEEQQIYQMIYCNIPSACKLISQDMDLNHQLKKALWIKYLSIHIIFQKTVKVQAW